MRHPIPSAHPHLRTLDPELRAHAKASEPKWEWEKLSFVLEKKGEVQDEEITKAQKRINSALQSSLQAGFALFQTNLENDQLQHQRYLQTSSGDEAKAPMPTSKAGPTPPPYPPPPQPSPEPEPEVKPIRAKAMPPSGPPPRKAKLVMPKPPCMAPPPQYGPVRVPPRYETILVDEDEPETTRATWSRRGMDEKPYCKPTPKARSPPKSDNDDKADHDDKADSLSTGDDDKDHDYYKASRKNQGWGWTRTQKHTSFAESESRWGQGKWSGSDDGRDSGDYYYSKWHFLGEWLDNLGHKIVVSNASQRASQWRSRRGGRNQPRMSFRANLQKEGVPVCVPSAGAEHAHYLHTGAL
eukprot:Skav224480  [mRNA]  locus=scaffold1302:778931:795261:- [translate_table: standard]